MPLCPSRHLELCLTFPPPSDWRRRLGSGGRQEGPVLGGDRCTVSPIYFVLLFCLSLYMTKRGALPLYLAHSITTRSHFVCLTMHCRTSCHAVVHWKC